MQFQAKHGFYESERKQGNLFELDFYMKGLFAKAADRDELSETVDYQLLEEIASKVMYGPSCRLIETLCKKIGDQIFSNFEQILFLELALRKINPKLKRSVEYAEIRMQWQR